MSSVNGEKQSLFEQHAQSIIAGLTLTILIGTGTLLISMRDDLSTMKAEMKFLSEKLNQAGDDRFRGSDWRREKTILDERFFELRSKVHDMEKRIIEIERRLDKNHPR